MKTESRTRKPDVGKAVNAENAHGSSFEREFNSTTYIEPEIEGFKNNV